MKREDLYGSAYAFKAAEAWETFEESQIFALRTGDRTFYVQVNGQSEKRSILKILRDEKSLESELKDLEIGPNDHVESLAAILSQDCLVAVFDYKKNLMEWEQTEVREYANAHDISTRGKMAWPRFLRSQRYQIPDVSKDPADDEMLKEALDAAAWAASGMKDHQLQIEKISLDSKQITLLHKDADGYSAELAPMPEVFRAQYPAGESSNDMYEARLKKLPKKGTWCCALMVCNEARTAEGVEGLYYPWRLLVYKKDGEKTVDVRRVRDYETRTNVMLDKLMDAMFAEEVCPKKIEVYDERTKALLQDWCKKVGIQFSMKEGWPEKMEMMAIMELTHTDEDEGDWDNWDDEDWDDDEGWEDAYDDWDEDDDWDDDEDWEEDDDELEDEFQDEFEQNNKTMMMILKVIESMPDEMLLNGNRQGLKRQVSEMEAMLRFPFLPPALHKRLEQTVDRLNGLLASDQKSSKGKGNKAGKKQGKKNASNKSFVISVSLGTGCYRHIQISGDASLETLSDAILSAFNFDNDHAHGFFMDNRNYSRFNCYYMEGVDPEYPSTAETTLVEAGVEPGKKFKYLFDFGDEWEFQCKVLKELEEPTSRPQIVREKGEAPEQYPDWDEDDD